MNKQKQLDLLKEEVERCKECKIETSGKMVFGEGNFNAKVMFVGEAPGKNEALVGRPFIGRSGKLLRSLIISAGLKEKDVYITSPVKYLPNSGTPSAKDIDHSLTHFNRQLEIINPRIIVLLGRTALTAVLSEKIGILSNHGKIIERNGKKYFITLHPASALRFAKNKPLLLEDFEKLKKIIS